MLSRFYNFTGSDRKIRCSSILKDDDIISSDTPAQKKGSLLRDSLFLFLEARNWRLVFAASLRSSRISRVVQCNAGRSETMFLVDWFYNVLASLGECSKNSCLGRYVHIKSSIAGKIANSSGQHHVSLSLVVLLVCCVPNITPLLWLLLCTLSACRL